MHVNTQQVIAFPDYAGVRCLMMPYIQGDAKSVPADFAAYGDIIASVCINRGDIGYLTIDESDVIAGKPHRGARAKHGRALHTEAGISRNGHGWGGSPGWGNPTPGWGRSHAVKLDRDVTILLANSIDRSCAVWNADHANTSLDGDIGYAAEMYPYDEAIFMRSGEVHKIGILTPHESLPIERATTRQFLRIVSSGVHGREEYFTINPLM